MKRMSMQIWLSVIVVMSHLLVAAQQCSADDWPQFLGPNRNGVSAETGLVSEWPGAGPKVLWRTPLGVSMSGTAIVGERLYTMFQDDAQQYVVCLDSASGREHWRTPIAPLYENGMGNGPRATPSVSGETVVCFSGEGVLAAFQTSDGRKLWSVDVPGSLGGAPAEYGVSCSPLIVDDLVIVHTGSESAATAAFRLSDGKLRWKTGRGKSGYSSPVMLTVDRLQQLTTFTAAGLSWIEPGSGTIHWSIPFPTEYDCNTANPILAGPDTVLISAGENHGSVIVKLTRTGSSWSAAEAWSSLGKDSQLRAEWQTPVIHDGHIYGLDNSGSAGPITNLVCIRIADHKTMWQKPRFGKSNLILADGKLFLTTMNGEVAIVSASPDAFRELARTAVMETTRQAPALSNGRLYVRDDKEVLCLDVRGN